jgi:hypothetical protein
MKNFVKDGGDDFDSHLRIAKSNEEKKKDNIEFIDTSSRPNDPKSELHNFPNPASKF